MKKLFIAGMIGLSMVNITQAETPEEKGLAMAIKGLLLLTVHETLMERPYCPSRIS